MLFSFVADVLLPGVALTWLFTQADGPWDVFVRLRERAGVDSARPGFFGKLLACGGCTAFWAGGAVGLVQALPRLAGWFGCDWWYPAWLAWMVRCPLAVVAIVVVLDMWKPYPPTDLSSVFGVEERSDGAESESEA